MANAIFKLNGNVVNPTKDWSAIQVLGTWDEDGGQANISLEDFTFINENAQTIRQYISDGLTGDVGIFEGIPFSIEIQGSTTLNVFDGILDLTEYEEINPVEVKSKIKKLDGLNQLSDRASGITMAWLYDNGYITQNDFINIPYIKEKPAIDTAADIALLGVTLFLFTKQLAESARTISKEITNATAHTAGGVTGPVAGAGYSISTIIIESIYTALLLFQTIRLIGDLLEILLPPIRYWKGIKLKTALTKSLQYIGYNYDSSITELDNLCILPLKNKQGNLSQNNSQVGYPSSSDFGYTVAELISLVNDMFGAKIKIDGNTVYQEPLINTNFVLQNSTYILPDVENEKKKFNANEIFGRYVVSYDTDLLDYWTIIQYEGTAYEIVTSPVNVNNNKAVLIKNYGETRIPYALGSKKDGLNPVEFALKGVCTAVDAVIDLFGGNGNNADKVQARTEMLHVTGEQLTVGKLLYLTYNSDVDRWLMYNDRYKIEANTLWNKYISNKSFVQYNFRNQKEVFDELKIPFGFNDFISLLNNSYCSNTQGDVIKIQTLKWQFDADFAIVSGWKRKPYTKNLTQSEYFGLENQ